MLRSPMVAGDTSGSDGAAGGGVAGTTGAGAVGTTGAGAAGAAIGATGAGAAGRLGFRTDGGNCADSVLAAARRIAGMRRDDCMYNGCRR